MAIWQPTSSSPLFHSGQTVTGLWNKRRYRIVEPLGAGANGEVYRVLDEQGHHRALKVSLSSADIAREHNLLQKLQGVAQGVDLGPPVFDLDDVRTRQGKAFFYVMERVEGMSLPDFVAQRGGHWLAALLLQLGTYLERLHALGHCFGDLKAENCLVHVDKGILRLVDFGGVTPFGRGVKEYTEWYDRAWWGRGSRKSDAGYDLFALSMLVVRLLAPELPGRMTRPGERPDFRALLRTVLYDPRFFQWRSILQAVWLGRIRSAGEWRQHLVPLVKPSVKAERKQKSKPRKKDWSDWLVLGSATFLLAVVFSLLF
ncbi:MAG TPA: phosphotransferase [Bacilli bacterium]|nr:phosphotransferase [Bacilli bacterium]